MKRIDSKKDHMSRRSEAKSLSIWKLEDSGAISAELAGYGELSAREVWR
jgi:hypothetical protein